MEKVGWYFLIKKRLQMCTHIVWSLPISDEIGASIKTFSELMFH